jgi:DNA-binding transcriptional ArsR family regulator
MAAGLLLLAVVALSPGLAGDSAHLDGAAPITVDAGPAGLSADGTDVAVSVDAPLPVSGTHVQLPAGLDLSLGSGSDAAPAENGAGSGSASAGPLAALADAPPAAVAAGGSLLAGILAFLVWLARPALGLFSRIEDDELASHPLRRQALDFIAANPGASVKDVQRSLGIAWGTTVYHLGRMERAGLVAVRRVGGRAGHWPLGQAPARDAPAPTGQALADLVAQRPGLSQAELAQLAGIGAPAACKQLRRLESAGLVAATRVGRSRVYHPGVSVSLKPAPAPVRHAVAPSPAIAPVAVVAAA